MILLTLECKRVWATWQHINVPQMCTTIRWSGWKTLILILANKKKLAKKVTMHESDTFTGKCQTALIIMTSKTITRPMEQMLYCISLSQSIPTRKLCWSMQVETAKGQQEGTLPLEATDGSWWCSYNTCQTMQLTVSTRFFLLPWVGQFGSIVGRAKVRQLMQWINLYSTVCVTSHPDFSTLWQLHSKADKVVQLSWLKYF